MSKSPEISNDTTVLVEGSRKNPFPGLRPFGINESHLYFGREGQSDEVLEILSNNHFVTILGSSGTGKSSLMFSGVIPSLHAGFISDAADSWKVISARPGLDPLRNLAKGFVEYERSIRSFKNQEGEVLESFYLSVLKSSSKGILEVYDLLNGDKNHNFLIYLDQFEEIFRFKSLGKTQHLNESWAYVNLILEAINQRDLPVSIALSMRSDFLGECEQFSDLTNKINESHYLIPQMTRDQKKLVIEGPVAVGNARIAPRLVQRVLNEMGDRPDQLPVLQHALMRSWSYWENGTTNKDVIDLIHYEAIGGVDQALSRHADEAFNELTDREQEICEVFFKTITEKRSDNDGVRRPTPLSEIAEVADVEEETLKLIVNKFRENDRALLMPPVGQELQSDSLVDISHEALMRVWYRLRDWVQEESESAKMYMKLAEAAQGYQENLNELWRPPDLQLALEWRRKNKPTLQWALRYDKSFERAMSFLDESEREYNRELKDKEIIQKRRLRRSRRVALILGIAVIFALGLVGFAYNQKVEADAQRALAQRNSEQARKNAADADKSRQTALTRLAEANAASKRALEEKTKAEQAAEEAERQRKQALFQKNLAETQTQKAQSATVLANEQTKVAETQRELAKASEEKARSLRLLSIAKSLAIKSLRIDG